jgi:hypothetical protein
VDPDEQVETENPVLSSGERLPEQKWKGDVRVGQWTRGLQPMFHDTRKPCGPTLWWLCGARDDSHSAVIASIGQRSSSANPHRIKARARYRATVGSFEIRLKKARLSNAPVSRDSTDDATRPFCGENCMRRPR